MKQMIGRVRRENGHIYVPYKYRPGEVKISAIPDPADQIFSHQSYDDGQWRHFHVATLYDMIASSGGLDSTYEQIRCVVEEGSVRFLLANHGIEQAHLDQMPLATLFEPGILCKLPDDSEIVVDGNHRYVKHYLLFGTSRTMPFWRLTEAECRPAMLDIPDELVRI